MADDAVFASAGDGLSPSSGIEITIEDGPGNSGEMLDGNGEEDFEIESDTPTDANNGMLDVIKSNGIEEAIQQVLGIERIDLENESELGIDCVNIENDSEHVLEFESDGFEIPPNGSDINTDRMVGVSHDDNGNATDSNAAVISGQDDGRSYMPPVVGMEFDSYDDAYNYYNCYAKELGFGIRIKSSWAKRNSKEKRGAVLCCSCEGFKTMKETATRRKETRTGCLAMIRLRLVESNRWKLDEVKLEHNHLLDHERAQSSRSHKKMEARGKRKLESAADVEVRTIKLYRTSVVDTVNHGSSKGQELNSHLHPLKCSRLGKIDIPALCNYFHEAQLADPNFFHVMDLSDDGYLKNVFWIDSRSRAAYTYFGDVVVIDTMCLSNNHDIPHLSFWGLNHHGQSVLLGCGLLADESMETYVWLMRAWLTCMLGRPPQTMITDRCKELAGAIAEVFPRARHRLCLPLVIQYISKRLGELGELEIFQAVLNSTVYDTLKVEEFETAWEEMVQHFAIRDHEWLQGLYEDRERWVPAYTKDTLLAGVYTSQPDEFVKPFCQGCLRDKMTWNEFFDMYESVHQEKIKREYLADVESREYNPVLRTSCSYEMQLSRLYTKEIFLKFQEEVVLMSGCFSVTQIHANGPIITCMVKERYNEGATTVSKNHEVVYDKAGLDIHCICSCFKFRGYLCRHALSVFNYNGVEEIPNQYILTRWRKDLKRLYTLDLGLNNINITNPVQWFDHLHRRAMQIVSEGMTSQDHHMIAWQALKESLNKVRLVVAEKSG